MLTTDKHKDLLAAVVALRGNCSPSKARKIIKSGQVQVDGNVVKIPTTEMKPGMKVSIQENPLVAINRKAPFQIYHEDKYICVFEKPEGLPAAKSGPKIKSAADQIMSYLRAKYGDEHFTVMNRVDKKESGLMLIAIGLKMKKFLIEEGQISYRHYALVEGAPKQEKLNWKHFLIANNIGLYKPTNEDKGKVAISKVQLMKKGTVYSLLKLDPVNYFKGQLRAQCTLQGMPIAGDKRYGAKTNPLQRTCLHLFSITLNHPKTGEKLEFKTRVPQEFLQLAKS